MEIDIYTLAHEIRNPLSVAMGYLSMTKNNEYNDKIKESIEDSLNILNNYLEYNKLILEREEIDIIYLIEEVMDNYKIYNINYTINDEEVYYNGDYYKLKQVFSNIIKNSIESNSTDIDFKVYNKKNIIKIEINNNGLKIDNINVINNMTTKINGNGIGTKINKKIIEMHQGNIEYYNTLNGVKIIINLPK